MENKIDMEKLIDIPRFKERSFDIFIAASELYTNYYAYENKELSIDNLKSAFERIHNIAQRVGDWETVYSDEPEKKFPLVPILIAYVRAMLIDRFPKYALDSDTDTVYRPETEYFIFSFIFMYVNAVNPNETRLLQPELLRNAADYIVESLIHFRYSIHDFNRMCVNLIVNNLFLYNRLYEGEQFNMLYNRDALKLLWENKANNEINGVIMLDGDKFKEVNDQCGHEEGDNILKIYVDSIISAINSNDALANRTYPARWGGEEFVVCIFNTTGDEILELAKKIKFELSTSSEWEDVKKRHEDKADKISFPRTISQGIALGNKSNYKSIGLLVGLADTQLYMAKDKEHGNRNCIYLNNEKVG